MSQYTSEASYDFLMIFLANLSRFGIDFWEVSFEKWILSLNFRAQDYPLCYLLSKWSLCDLSELQFLVFLSWIIKIQIEYLKNKLWKINFEFEFSRQKSWLLKNVSCFTDDILKLFWRENSYSTKYKKNVLKIRLKFYAKNQRKVARFARIFETF